MTPSVAALVALGGMPVAALVVTRVRARLILSRAKHRSLQGHSKLSRAIAALVPYYAYDDGVFFSSDGPPPEIAAKRRGGFNRVVAALNGRAPVTQERTAALEPDVSDLQFVNTYRVPFQYRRHLSEQLRPEAIVDSSDGVLVRDLDGNVAYDLTGSYGMNVFGYDFYKACIDAGSDRVRALGPLLGSYHPVVQDNVDRLKAISGLDEVSFHMSGTGNPRRVDDVYTLNDMDERSFRVLRTRRDIACVLVNPLQALHPNNGAPGDSMLIDSSRRARRDRRAYAA